MENLNVRTTPHTDLYKTMLTEPEKYADFYRSTMKAIREDMEKEFDDVVTFSTIFLQMNQNDKQKWVDGMRDKWVAVMGKLNATLLEKQKAYIAWEHYHRLLTEQ